jgi:hypothetical protein
MANEIQTFFGNTIVRVTALAFIAHVVLVYLMNKTLPDIPSIIIAFVVITTFAYLLSSQIRDRSFLGVSLIGMISYGIYNFGIIYLKLVQGQFVIKEELLGTVLYGLITGIIYIIMGERK